MFQAMMSEMMGGVSIKEMLQGLSERDLREMPPFPFPKELFPPSASPIHATDKVFFLLHGP